MEDYERRDSEDSGRRRGRKWGRKSRGEEGCREFLPEAPLGDNGPLSAFLFLDLSSLSL